MPTVDSRDNFGCVFYGSGTGSKLEQHEICTEKIPKFQLSLQDKVIYMRYLWFFIAFWGRSLNSSYWRNLPLDLTYLLFSINHLCNWQYLFLTNASGQWHQKCIAKHNTSPGTLLFRDRMCNICWIICLLLLWLHPALLSLLKMRKIYFSHNCPPLLIVPWHFSSSLFTFVTELEQLKNFGGIDCT